MYLERVSDGCRVSQVARHTDVFVGSPDGQLGKGPEVNRANGRPTMAVTYLNAASMQDLVGVLVGPCGRVMEKGAVCVNRWNRWESGIGRRQVMWERTTGTGGTRSKREAGQAGTHRTKGAGRGEGGMVSRALMCAARTREGGAGGRSARAQHWGGKSERAPVSWSLPVGLAWGWPWIAPSPSFVAQAGAHTRPLRQGKGDTAAAAENERSGRSDRWRPEGISTTPTDSLSPAADTHCLRVRLK